MQVRRAALSRSTLVLRGYSTVRGKCGCRHHSSAALRQKTDLSSVLSRSTWSVRSLLPSGTAAADETTISSSQLHHLLRLSALPMPRTPEEETKMIQVLQSQLRFVRDVQAMDTEGVEPLRSIRDETEDGMKEAAIGLAQLREALANETAHGHSKRPRMEKKDSKPAGDGDWDVLGTAAEKVGRYFVVRTGNSTEG
ncbi:hypothetical protein GQ53DRAFT_654646 [Thozetella sp. PMI_491]|nr:hypothetical protein GQ53DRAFT_654646 [Thozetella sp. PMI_491]